MRGVDRRVEQAGGEADRSQASSPVTIVLYHYVRDRAHSRYPGIKALETGLFKEQLLYARQHYHLITMEHLIESIDTGIALPPKAMLLTFDDGYLDHYTHVFPLLVQHGIQGSFFPPVRAVMEHAVLDLNKVHHVLAVADPQAIVADIYAHLDRYRAAYDLAPNEFYYKKFAVADRFDTADVIFIKRLLQRGLEAPLRKVITAELFAKFIGVPEHVFARELYLTTDQLTLMKDSGMYIGSHGFDHRWLDSLSPEDQEEEIAESLAFLRTLGLDLGRWTMSYPYGGYNAVTVELLKKHQCRLAFTCEVGVATASNDNRFTLPRLDPNDLPVARQAPVNAWYELG